MDMLAERDLVRNGNDLWLYNSADNSAAHMTMPPNRPALRPRARRLLPERSRLMSSRSTSSPPSAYNRRDRGRRNRGGRPHGLPTGDQAAEYRHAGRFRDNRRRLRLRPAARRRGAGTGQAAAAFSLAFTDVSLSAPDAALFSFTPPAVPPWKRRQPRNRVPSPVRPGKHRR